MEKFTIQKNRSYYDVLFNGKRVLTADTLHEAEKDIEELEASYDVRFFNVEKENEYEM